MRCKDAQGMMNAWIDEELLPDKKEALEDHLVNCRTCAAEAQELRRLTSFLDTCPPVVPSAGLKKRTLSLFLEETAHRRGEHWGASLGLKMQAAMAAGVLIGLGIGGSLGAGWASTQLLGEYCIAGFLFSAGDLLFLWA